MLEHDFNLVLETRFGYSSPTHEVIIFDVDRAHDTKVFGRNGKIKTLPKTKLILPELLEEKYVRVGHYIWLFGRSG